MPTFEEAKKILIAKVEQLPRKAKNGPTFYPIEQIVLRNGRKIELQLHVELMECGFLADTLSDPEIPEEEEYEDEEQIQPTNVADGRGMR